MLRTRVVWCPLVDFVHARCFLPSSTATPSTAPGAATSVQRVAIDDGAALADAVRENRPVVLHGLPLPPKCLGDDLLSSMRELCGHREVPVRLPPSSGSTMFGDTGRRAVYDRMARWRFYRVVDEVRAAAAAAAGEDGHGAMRCYAANLPIEARLPELAAHLLPVIEVVEGAALKAPFGSALPQSPGLYLGAARQRTPLHFDPTENLTTILQGSKLFRLFPPPASSQLEPCGGRVAAAACWLSGTVPAVYSGVDPWAPASGAGAQSAGDGAALASRLPLPEAVAVEVHEGEVLYLPVAWWHAVQGSPEANASVVFGFEPREVKG